MPRKNNKPKQAVRATFKPRESSILIGPGLLCLTAAVLIAVAILDYAPRQPGLIRAFALSTEMDVGSNLVGRFGRDLSFLLLNGFGVGIAFPILAVFWWGILFLFRRAYLVNRWRVILVVLGVMGASGLAAAYQAMFKPNMAMLFPEGYFLGDRLGGLLGHLLADRFLLSHLGLFGGTVLLLGALAAGMGALFFDSSERLFQRTFSRCYEALRPQGLTPEERQSKAEEKERLRAERLRRREERRQQAERERLARIERRKASIAAAASAFPVEEEKSSIPAKAELPVDSEIVENLPERRKRESVKPEPVRADPAPRRKQPPSAPAVEPAQEEIPARGPADGLKIVAGERVEKAQNLFQPRKGNYRFPPLDLLAEPPEAQGISEEDHREVAMALKETLQQFGIEVELGEVHTGPVITRYEILPAPGVRVEKIANLAKNIGMALRAQSIRILAPVPGKGCVGVEMPNRTPLAVCMREIVESRAWVDAKAEIPVVLGKEVSGKPLVADLTKMPHLLIAGSTGSGKTVCINSIIASLLYHSSPDDLRFIMVDPKIVEMQVYNSLPHMLIPVVTDPKKVPGALKWLISEMERRYHIFSRAGVRNVAGFNAKVLKNKEDRKRAEELDGEMSAEERAALALAQADSENEEELPTEKLPYIVCIVDELADLMMVAPADIETGIARLAQLARAAGIHLIIATQRPSVNVITGIIKANLPSRIAFKVASKIDSRTILDEGGADALIGKGDMLFIPPGAHTLVRAQGAFVSDEEINAIVDFLKVNGPPQILESIQAQIEAGEDEGGATVAGDFEDELVPQALEVIRTSKRASTSMLQRRLRIGYNRAARIMEILEDEGYVGPENGAQPREILRDD